MSKKKTFPHEPGKCQFCADAGILPSEAIACALHSILAIEELKAEVAVLKNTAGASSRLHLALADLDSCVPSKDGKAELASVKETRMRLDYLVTLLERALSVANYELQPPKSKG